MLDGNKFYKIDLGIRNKNEFAISNRMAKKGLEKVIFEDGSGI